MGLLDRLRRLLGADDGRDGERADAGAATAGESDGDTLDPHAGRTYPSAETAARAADPDDGEDGPDEAEPSAATRERAAAVGRVAGENGENGDGAVGTRADDGDTQIGTRTDDGELRIGADGGTPGEAPIAEAVGDDPDAFHEQAAELAEFWDEYDLDFTPASLPQLDQLLADQADSAGRMRVELDDGRTATVAPIAASTACYFAEVFCRAYDARWAEDEDYRWALAVPTPRGGEVRLNAFGIAHDGLEGAPRFAVTHDALVVEVGLDGETVADPQTEAAAAQGEDDVATAEDLRQVADDDPEVAMAAAAAGIDADELVEGFREDAAGLVDAWPSYDLDYSPDSLERLDALVRMELQEEAFDRAEFGGTTDELSLLFTVRGMQLAGYLAEVFRRHAGAAWETDGGLALAVEGADGTAEVDPLSVAVDALRTGDSLAATYDGVVSTLGIDDAGVDIDPDDPDFAPGVGEDPAVDGEGADAGMGEDAGADGDGVSMDMDVDPEDVDVELDVEDLDVDVAPSERAGSSGEDENDAGETGDGSDGDGDGDPDGDGDDPDGDSDGDPGGR